MQETEAKRKRLASTKRRSLALLAEVKYDSSWALALWLHVTASIILLLLLLLFSFTNCVAASCRKVLEKEVPVLSEGWLAADTLQVEEAGSVHAISIGKQ
jgi:hypothetical protein